MHFSSNRSRDPQLYEKVKPLLLSQWSGNWRGRFNTVDVQALPFLDCGRLSLTLKKSLISHQQAGPGIFPTRRFGQSMLEGCSVVLWNTLTSVLERVPC